MNGARTITLVLADELALVREAIAALCESTLDCRVVGQCGDGASACKLIEDRQPDVAILDLKLPGLHAPEVVRRVRQAGLRTRVIVLSVQSDRRTVIDALGSGAQGFLLKSGPSLHLIEAISQVVDGGVYVSPLIKLNKVFGQAKKRAAADAFDSLSAREHEVFALLVEGVRPKEIAARLGLSPKTVDTHRAGLMRKLGIHDLAGLVKFAVRRNLTTR